MRKLRGTLNVACFEEVFEDAEYVHIVMEWCRGGELHHRIGDKHYSERTVRPPSGALSTPLQHSYCVLSCNPSVDPQHSVRCGCRLGAR